MNPSPRDNFYRCMTLIVDNGNEAAWELLDYYLSNQGTTLKDFIENNQHEIYHLCYNNGCCCRCQYGTVYKPKSRILYQSQLDILLDTKGTNIPCNVHVRAKPTCSHTINDDYANPSIATKQLDLTLCRCLLFNFTNILPQGSVERKAFEDLINMRNKCCHVAKGEISSKDYQAYKAQIEQCLLVLAQIYGKTHDMTLKIKDAEKRPFDESICKQLQQTILQEQVLQGVSGLHKHIESSQEAEERTTIEIHKLGKSTKRTLRAVNLSQKSAGHTASKIQKLEESSKRTLMVVKSSKKSLDHTASKVQKLEENTEKKIQAVENTAANIEKKLEESSERTIQAVASSQESMATKIQKLEERLSKCETSKRNRLIDLTETEINNHLTEETFVETPAVEASVSFLETNSLLILTGAAGSGKSRNSLDILNKFRIKHTEYEIIKLTELHEFTDIVKPDEKLVILFEDVFGRTNIRFTENTDIQIIDRLQACLNKGKVKAILTVRDTIKVSCQRILTLHKIFNGKCEVDLSSVEFKMSRDKKESLLLNYFKKFNLRVISLNEDENYFKEEILKENISVTLNHKTLYSIIESEPLLGFPEACSLFTRNRKLIRLGIRFFNHPSKYLYDEIEKIRKNGKRNTNDKLLYVTLVYLLLNGDVLDENSVDTAKGMDIMKSCYGSQQERLLPCDITDAAAEMKGRYLTYRHDTFRYHFQHQTVLESVMISYSKIEQEVVISMLSFDFIREMVRLQNYRENEGEVILKVSQTLYDKLAERIVKILQSQYFKKALTFNLQLLCDMQIIREDDEYFITSLLTASHNAYMSSSYNLETDILVECSFRKFKLYFPAIFLEYVGRQTGMHTSLTCMFHHLRSILQNETNDDLLHVCKYYLLQTFFDICEKDSESLLEAAWGVLKLFISFEKHREYFQNIIDKACISCPITTLEWMFKTFDKEIFEGRRMLLNACLHKRLNSVKFLFKSFKHETFDFNEILIAALKNVRKESNTEILQCLLENIEFSSVEMSKSILSVCEIIWPSDIDALLKNADPSLFDSKSILKKAVRNKREGSLESLVKWIIAHVNPQILDLTEIMNIVCVLEVLEIGKLLIQTIENKLLDVNVIMIAAIQKYWEGEHESFILWLLSNIDLALFNFKTIEAEACKNGKFDEIKLLLTKIDHNLFDLGKIMQESCKQGKLDLVQYLLSVDAHSKLQVDTAIMSACSTGQLPIVKYFIIKCDQALLDIKLAMQKAVVCGKHNVVAWLLFNCDQDMFDMENLMNKACSFGWLDIVKWLFEKIDTSVFDMLMAIHEACDKSHIELITFFMENIRFSEDSLKSLMTISCFKGNIDIVKLLLDKEKDGSFMYDMRLAMNDACSGGRLQIVQWLLKSFKHETFDMVFVLKWALIKQHLDLATSIVKNINTKNIDTVLTLTLKWAQENNYISFMKFLFMHVDIKDKVNRLCEEGHFKLIQWILQNHDSLDMFDLKKVFYQSCHNKCLDVVGFILENIDHKKLDIKETVNAFMNDRFCVPYRTDEYVTLLKLILEKVNHDSIDLKKLFYQSCHNKCLDFVGLMLENIDHKKLDIKETVNDIYSSFMNNRFCDPYRTDKYVTLLELILEKVNHDSIDLKKVFNQVCRYSSLDVVEFLLENIDHKKLDIKEAVNNACNPSIDEDAYHSSFDRKSTEKVINLQLQKVKVDLFDMEGLMNEACRKDYLNVVRWLVKNIDHSMFDIDTAINVLMLHNTEKGHEIFKLLLENISQNLFNIGSVIDQASRLNHTENVLWLLQNKNNTLLDMKYVMNEACRNGNLQIIRYALENIDKKSFDFRSAMNKACRNSNINSLEVVNRLLESIPHDMLDLEIAMNNACRYDNVVVVQWFWNNLDRTLFNVKTAWNNACYNCNAVLISYLLHNMDKKMLDKSKALSQACRNHEEGDEVISLLFKEPNMNTPENCKLVLTEACVHGNENVVSWLLSNTDIQQLEYKETLIDTIKATTRTSNDRDEHKSLVWFMLTHRNINKLDRNDISDILEAVSSIGQLDMVQLLLRNTEQSMFNMRAIVNTACESGKFEIVDWFLQNIELKNIDVQTVMVESCGYGWLKIVKLLLLKFDRENFDMRTSMDEACSYCRYEIVKFLLENVDSNLLDTKLVLEKACGYGWKDIILWLFDNIDNISIDSKECIFEACAQGRLEIVELFWSKYGRNNFDVDTLIGISCTNSGNRGVTKFLIENFDLTQLHIDIIVRNACKYSWTEIVTSILNSCKNNKNLMEEAMKYSCNSGETEIVKILLDNVDVGFIEIKSAMIISCRKGWDELVSLLLEGIDHSLFDFTVAMNEACRYGEADIVELLIQKVDHKFFNFENAIMEAFKSHLNENLVLTLLKYINRSTIDIETVSEKSYDYGWRKVSSRLKRMIYNDK